MCMRVFYMRLRIWSILVDLFFCSSFFVWFGVSRVKNEKLFNFASHRNRCSYIQTHCWTKQLVSAYSIWQGAFLKMRKLNSQKIVKNCKKKSIKAHWHLKVSNQCYWDGEQNIKQSREQKHVYVYVCDVARV